MVVLCHGSDYFLAGLKSVDISNKNQLSGVLIFYRYCKRITDKPQVQIAAMLLQISRPLKPWDMQNIYAITS